MRSLEAKGWRVRGKGEEEEGGGRVRFRGSPVKVWVLREEREEEGRGKVSLIKMVEIGIGTRWTYDSTMMNKSTKGSSSASLTSRRSSSVDFRGTEQQNVSKEMSSSSTQPLSRLWEVTHKQNRIPNLHLFVLLPSLPPVKPTKLVRRHPFGVEVRNHSRGSVRTIPQEASRVGEERFRLIAKMKRVRFSSSS